MRFAALALLAALSPANALALDPAGDQGERAIAEPLLAPATGAGQESCTPDFPLKEGWLGGDGVYSVPLSKTDSVWLFGDSFVARSDTQSRNEAALISNSIALSRCVNGVWSITYHWNRRGAVHEAFFHPPEWDRQEERHAVRYWPLDGVIHEGVLTLFMMRVETVDAGNPFGFAITGTDLIRIGNPSAPPEAWDMRVHALGRQPALTGSGLVVENGHVVLATPLEEAGGHPVILTRLPFDGLDDPGRSLQTLTGPGAWTKGLTLDTAVPVIANASSELSLQRLPGIGDFLVIHMDPEPFSSRIVYRTAPSVAGPWSPMRDLLTIPDAQERDTDTVFCYAGKAHHQFDRVEEDGISVLLTYACNSTDFTLLLEDTDLYRPRTARVTLPPKGR